MSVSCSPVCSCAPVELDGGAQGQRGPPAEPPGVGGQVKLKRYNLEDNFHHDMEQYLSTGYLQIAERRGEMGARGGRGGGTERWIGGMMRCRERGWSQRDKV